MNKDKMNNAERPAKIEAIPMLSAALSFSDLKLVAHSLGIDLFKSVISLKQKDKKLPFSFYRNYYNASERQAGIAGIDKLVEKGFMEKSVLNYYYVTDRGIEKFKKQFSELAIYKPKSEMNIDYLRHRINFYCTFYNYNFCANNSDHVIEYAYKLLIGREYVSYTTKNVIGQFKTELKKLVKEQGVS